MSREFQFKCPLPNGVHARPASALEEIARNFAADTTIINDRTGHVANAKSVLAIVGADIRHGDSCRLIIGGQDADDALAALSNFLRHEFPHCDNPPPAPPTAPGRPGEIGMLPPSLRHAGATLRHGKPLVGGIGCGRIVHCGGWRMPPTLPLRGAADGAAETRKLETGLAALEHEYEQRLARRESRLERELLKAHQAIARDPEFRAKLRAAAQQETRTAAGAIADVERHFTTLLARSDSALLRERAQDVQDVCFQLLRQIYGPALFANELALTDAAIVIADTMTPDQFLSLDRKWLQGLVLGQAGPTSHTVILARAASVPTLTGLTEPALDLSPGSEAILDAECGLILTGLTEATRRYYAMEERRLAERRTRLLRFAQAPARTADGARVEIGANISAAPEAEAAFAAGAEGIGLFRTEMLFLDRAAPPTEAEQFEAYRRVLQAAGNRPVIIRTLDIGGDKPLAYLNLPVEDNPFLGYRAVRIYPEYEALFRTQIRALVRASAHGNLKILLPMVTTPEEVRWARQVVREEQEQCRAAGLAGAARLPVGAMIEVPAAAFLLDELCREADFFSIGSNDLLQYFAGADRANPRLSKLFDPLQPAFLRLLHKIVSEARAAGKWIGLCGEMGGQLQHLPLLLGLGLDEISVAPALVAAVKAELAGWPLAACRELTAQALRCGTATEVRQGLEESASRRPVPLVEPELILLESHSASKAEAIKEAVDRLYALGRTTQPRAIEEALWQREAVYSTGFGHGLAVPHCQTNAVQANSLLLLKLRQPVTWDAVDGQPVHLVLLLTLRAAAADNGHLKIFSRLARRLMHEEFRAQLERENDPAKLCALLDENLTE